MQHLVQVQQLLPLALHQLRHRDAGPAGHDLGDLLVGDPVAQQLVLPRRDRLPLAGLQLLLQLGQLAVFQLGGPVQVVLALGLFDVGVHLLDLLAQLLHLADRLLLVLPFRFHAGELVPQPGQLPANFLKMLLRELVVLFFEGRLLDLVLQNLAAHVVHLGGHRVHLGADGGAGLVHQVDGLVGQKAVGDVAVAQGSRRDQGAVGDLDAVVDLVPLFQAAQDADGVLHSGFVHQHRLETPLQRRVLFDVLPVLVEGGGADAVQLAPGQQGL